MDTSKTLVSFIFVYLAAVLHVSHEAFHRKSSHRKVEDVYYQPTPSLEPSMEIFNYEEFCREVYSPTMASHGQVKSLLPLFYLFGGYFLLNAFLCVASLTCSSTITSYSTESTTYSTTLIESTTSLTTTSIIESTTIATTSSSTTLATLTSTTTSVETSLFFTTTTTSTTSSFATTTFTFSTRNFNVLTRTTEGSTTVFEPLTTTKVTIPIDTTLLLRRRIISLRDEEFGQYLLDINSSAVEFIDITGFVEEF